MSLQSKVLSFLKQQPNTWAIKVITANERGCPDILCCVAGMFVAIEIKEGKDRLSSIQKEQMKRIREAGGRTVVMRSVEDVKELM